jgi:ABC-type oligopeptide transport system substrate-binding subunit
MKEKEMLHPAQFSLVAPTQVGRQVAEYLTFTDGKNIMGTEMAPQIAALKAGEVDMIDLSDVAGFDVFQAVRNDPNIQIIPVTSASNRVLRMRVDMKPWDDNKVRTALKICQHHEKLLSLVCFNEELQGQDFHGYQLHPEFSKLLTQANGLLNVDERRKVFCNLEDIQQQMGFH